MTLKQAMKKLTEYGSDQTKKVYIRHGAREPLYGVKLADLKKIAREIKTDRKLALVLYDSGNSDAMYLAGLIADPNSISKEDLRSWVNKAYWYMLSEYAVAKLAAASPYGWALGLEWINSDQEMIEAAGWSTLSNWVSLQPVENLHKDALLEFMELISEKIHISKNRVRYAMNGFIIAVGSYVPSLTDEAVEVARKIGKVHVDMGETACKVPLAEEYIKKVISMKKKKSRNAHRL